MKSVIFTLACLVLAGHQQAGAQASRFSYNKYIEKGDTLNYRMLFPDANRDRKYPLVIFLHGAGERGNDNEAQLKWGVQNFATDQNMVLHPAIVVAPQCPENMTWSNFSREKNPLDQRLQSQPSRPMQLVLGLLQQLIKTLPVDTNRIYITGLSMGGFGTFDAIERFPRLFAAAVPVCGGGDLSLAPSIAQLPVWIFHGSEDPVVTPSFSIEMAQALMKAGAHPGLTSYPETGHFSWLAAYRDPQMMEWLFRQHR
ncbi:MAG TPA: prolyl oligopeptidase family serine peptidase [Chitinophagaceae bacterium]|nr:prolyl oligopeptidase family serine peptidase [Chitinophagaceae bacterium]